ncbi:MAG: alanyl-tRNA editing protein [Chloroflexota bacterium]
MTKLLYYQDAYMQEFDAAVTQVEETDKGSRIALEQSAFYPGGGGQPNDTGWLEMGERTYEVTRVKKEGAHLWHWIQPSNDGTDGTDGGEPLITTGVTIHGRLDWERRHKLMRTHTAMHILCGVVWRDYQASVTGGNMDPGKSRMDFEFEALTRELISEIEEKCHAEIAAAREIRTQVLPREEAFQIPDLIRTKINLLPDGIREVRTVEIVGLDLQADGGTHLNNTRDVGAMKIVDYKSKGKINKRIYIELGS